MAAPPPRPSAQGSQGSQSAPSHTGTRQKESSAEKPVGTYFLGRYRVVDEIGVGGMASVHLARMDGPGGFQKWVAIKRIHPHLVEDDQFVDMFLDEARIAAGINHANVAQVFDLGKDENTYWIAMEYLHGEPLREIMRRVEDRNARVAPELAARICADAAEGLHAAHELRGKNGQLLNLVHRDVTPHNLFITYDGYTKVVDFGIAKVADRLSQTRAGTLKGKLAYMSPEQVRGADVDRTTDVFALGVVLWELVTNQRLFRMETDLDTLEKVQACQVPLPSTMIPGFPQELEQVILKSLAKRKQDRYPTAREFSRALNAFLMRRGAFVGPEEVAQFVRAGFADRIQKREAHLAWAAEVTSTINVDQLRGGAAEEASSVSYSKGGGSASLAGGSAGPASQVRGASQAQMAAQSLLDDDEDVPTTVATRDQMAEKAPERPRPPPAAGMPAPPPAAGLPPPPPGGGMHPGMQTIGMAQGMPLPSYGSPGSAGPPTPGRPPGPPPPRPPPPPTQVGFANAPQAPYGGGQQPQFGGAAQREDHTAAFPGGSGGEDFGSTIALPQPSPAGRPGAPPPAAGNVNPPSTVNFQPGIQGPPGGMMPGMMGPPGMYGTPGPAMPQSQIETAISLPRPDPAAIWLAQQQASRGQGRNTGMLIAIVAITALCVIGIVALLYFKFRSGRADVPLGPEVVVAASSVPPSTTTASPTVVAPAATTSAASTAAAAATEAPSPTGSSAASASGSGAPAGTGAKKDSPGFLTLSCDPRCDQVSVGGKVFVPPIVHEPFPPGSYRANAKLGASSKVVSVIIVSGQNTPMKISMKH